MKLIRNIIAVVIAFVMAFSVTGCHKKNEIAVKVGDVEFTSAYYMCALINAYSEAQGKVQENAEDSDDEIDYFKEKIDDKKFETWVKDRAIEILEETATYQKLCKDAKVEMDEETKGQAEYTAYYMWSMYGYSSYFEPNGVSFETFTKYTVDSYYPSLYFKHLYAEGGEKEISSSDVEKKLYDDFIIADLIDVTFDKETDKEKAEIKSKLDAYVKDLNSGKKTFEEVYNDYNEVEEKEETDKETADKETENTENTDGTEEEEELKPLDEYAQILGAKDTGYESDYFEEVKKMADKEVKLITKEDNEGYVLIVKKDIKADPYYRENLDITVRHLLKDDEFDKDMEGLIKKTEAKVNGFAVDRFKVKKIKEPSYS